MNLFVLYFMLNILQSWKNVHLGKSCATVGILVFVVSTPEWVVGELIITRSAQRMEYANMMQQVCNMVVAFPVKTKNTLTLFDT